MRPEELIPQKTLQELVDSAIAELRNQSFRVTNFKPGGVFRTLLEKCNQGVEDLYGLLRKIAPQMFLATATGVWLDLKAAEYGVFRRLEQKTQGVVFMGRFEPGDSVIIPQGTVVATDIDRFGDRLKYVTTGPVVLENGTLEVAVPVEAELPGARYNVGAGQIKTFLTLVRGIDYVRNDEGWITREGADVEDDETLRQRAIDRWNQLSQGGNDDAYRSWAQEIPGVVVVHVDSQHPRGQGTVDIIITGTAGIPTDDLVSAVQEHIRKKKSLVADVLVMKPEPVYVNFDLTLYLHPDYGDEETARSEAESIIDIMFMYGDTTHPQIRKVSPVFGLPVDQVKYNLLSNIEHIVKVDIREPAADLMPTIRQVLVKGSVSITVERVAT
ncbi:baseplate J/gp47 family protein [Desulfofundulus sp. TPOSR]|uniref:baseplate J/gp47 family protein n=1 Tax=Desulfofundulus sp. TPOSR TaxID=2714340 RepID=UPI00140A1412|nr:baseplate J/gp47 family protein [Desulfofundulus sp. TPOSR]NHM25470.1 baseplate J/gp47 family protein [Desulfofundulus sp. TPOSR]NHM27058.1 baseplate J/gp47 family protein [Desulfofundulus sp. TPOSR]